MSKQGDQWSTHHKKITFSHSVIQSLSQGVPQPDHLLKFLLGNIIDRTPLVVDIDTIASTAFILPYVQNTTDEFPLDIKRATYFLIMPPMANW